LKVIFRRIQAEKSSTPATAVHCYLALTPAIVVQ
jgi:hypothetical protein